MSSSYDRAITIFSPDGHLFQVEYAQEAVKKGSTAVAVRGVDCVAIGVEKKSIPQLQIDRTIRKIFPIDDHVMLAFAGLSADARQLVDRARVECQSFKLTLEDQADVGYLARYVANVKQRFTMSPGRRPYGVSMLFAGFDRDGTARLYKSEPSGAYYEYRACATGRGEKPVDEYLEEHATNDDAANNTREALLRMVVKSLSQVVQSGAQNIEIAVLTRLPKPTEEQLAAGDVCKPYTTEFLSVAEIEELLKSVADQAAADGDAAAPSASGSSAK